MDGIGLLNVTKFNVNNSRAQAINASLMGPQGYFYAYGSELPIFDFMSQSDKEGKKSLTAWPKKSAIAVTIERKQYGTGAALVHNHYKFNVGIAYNMCSALTFVASNYMAKAKTEAHMVEALNKACAIVWRKIYEGQGLSGYSPEAIALFNALYEANNKKASVEDRAKAKAEVAELLGVEIEVAAWLVYARGLCMGYNAKERYAAKKINHYEQAVLVGALRRIGQGRTSGYDLDSYNPTMEASEGEASAEAKSLYLAVQDFGLLARLEIGFVKSALADGIAIHSDLVSEFGELNAEAEWGY